MITFACPDCAKRYSVDEALAGKRAKCKQCGYGMTVPSPARAGQGSAPRREVAPSGFDPFGLDDGPARVSGSAAAAADEEMGYGLAEPAASRSATAVAEAPPVAPPRAGTSPKKKKATKSKSSSGVMSGRGGAGMSVGGVIAVGLFVLRIVAIGHNGFGFGLSARSEVEQYAETNLAGLQELTSILATVHDQSSAAAATPRAVEVMNRLVAEARRVKDKKARTRDIDAVEQKYKGQIEVAGAALDRECDRVSGVPGGEGVLLAIQGPAQELSAIEGSANGGKGLGF